MLLLATWNCYFQGQVCQGFWDILLTDTQTGDTHFLLTWAKNSQGIGLICLVYFLLHLCCHGNARHLLITFLMMFWFPGRSGDSYAQHASQHGLKWGSRLVTQELSLSHLYVKKNSPLEKNTWMYQAKAIIRGIFLGRQFCKWHKFSVTCVTRTIQRTHVLCTKVKTLSTLFTPAEEINFCAQIEWWWVKNKMKDGEELQR